LVDNSQGQTIFGFRPLVIYFEGVSGVPQPALSTPTVIYNFFSKFEPYAYLPQNLALDATGPVAVGIPRGARAGGSCQTTADCPNGSACSANKCYQTCSQHIGATFKDIKTDCIEVHGPAGNPDMVDQVNLNKMLYGLGHDQEHFSSNNIGVNQNFTSKAVSESPDKVLLDSDTPSDDDLAQDFFFDLRARGHTLNDYQASGAPDYRGSAMIYIEWARLMLIDINQQMKAAGMIPKNQPPKRLGDPTCTGFGANGPNFAPGCSGIEGLIIPDAAAYGLPPPDFTKDASCANAATCLDPGSSWDIGEFYAASILKPGDIVGGFCVDPGSFTDCSTINSPWYTAQQWVLRLVGNGNLNQVPSELRDRRYYFKWFSVAYLKYLKAYSDFGDKANRDNYPCSTSVDPTCMNGGIGPNDVMNQLIDRESLFFDSNNQGGGNGFDKFEYIDREYIGHGQEGTSAEKWNWVPFDFEYGSDLVSGNQRYDNWYRRMDREEIAMYATMLEDRDHHTPGQENNVNITNLFGTQLLPSIWSSFQCAIGQGGAATGSANGCSTNPPLDATNMTTCVQTSTAGVACDGMTPCQGSCSAGQFCVAAKTYETGNGSFCGTACDFNAHPTTGCAQANQTCVGSSADGATTTACVDMMMDLNGPTAANPRAILSYYPSVWTRAPFSMGHSPIAIHQADKNPMLGVAKVSLPNFADGPYTPSPMTSTTCPSRWTPDPNGANTCNAPLSSGSNWKASSFAALTPWLERQPGVGFSFPIDGQHDQFVPTAQLDYTGILETYVVDLIPWVDLTKPSCIADDPTSGMACSVGYVCNPATRACEAKDDSQQVLAIEGDDFLGEVFLCQDPFTGDVLHARQYDSANVIVDWLAAHQGGWDPSIGGFQPSAQSACNIIIRYSPYNNYIDFITSKAYGVKLDIALGAGLGRVVNVVLYDSSITEAQ
jgi:hypothetical protein